MNAKPFHIVFALYPGVTQLDFTGPHQFLRSLPGAVVTVASTKGGNMDADDLTFAGLTPLIDIEHCDLLCVPGGLGTTEALLDEVFIEQIRRLAGMATWTTSVCTGSLILGAAGLLRGKRAACHWAWRDQLTLFDAVPDPRRVVRDGNVITGGGVTAGIDFALTVVAEIAGVEFAQGLQLALEYAPAPPFDAGRTDQAPSQVLARVQAMYGAGMPERRAAATVAAGRIEASAGAAN